MKMIKIIKRYQNLKIFVFLTVLIFLFTNGFLTTFFQQDEWHEFGILYSYYHQPLSIWLSMTSGQHFFPLNLIFWKILFEFFGFNAFFYNFMSLFLHAVASFLVFIFIRNISKSFYIGLLGAVLFALDSRIDQAFLHLAVFSNTVTAFILILLSLIYLQVILERKNIYIKDVLILSVLFLSSTMFREDGLLLIPLIPSYIFIFSRKTFNKKNTKFFLYLTLTGITAVFIRIYIQFLDIGSTSATNPHITSHAYLKTFIINAVSFPIKIVVQNVIEGYNSIYILTDKYKHLFFLNVNVDTNVLIPVSLFILFDLIIAIFLILKIFIKGGEIYKFILFSIIGIIFYSLLLSSVGRTMSLIEPRYLYFTGFLIMSILGWLLVEIFNSKLRKNYNNVKKLAVLIFIFLYCIYSFSNTQYRLHSLQKVSEARKSILSQLIMLHPNIPKKTIFFVKCKNICSSNSEFGINNQVVLPFSSGPGWIFLLQYTKNNPLAYSAFFHSYNKKEIVWNWMVGEYRETIADEFLWDLGAQGYNTINDYSFGYYVDKNLLKKDILERHINKNNIIALEYDDKNFKFKDISIQIRNQL